MKRLIAQGLIEPAAERIDPAEGTESRRYYRLSQSGLRALQVELKRQSQIGQTAIHLPKGGALAHGFNTTSDRLV